VFRWKNQTTNKKRLQIFLSLIISNLFALMLAIAFRGPFFVVLGIQFASFIFFVVFAHVRGREIIRNAPYKEVVKEQKPLVPFIKLDKPLLSSETDSVESSPEDEVYMQEIIRTSNYRGNALRRENRSSLYLVPDQEKIISQDSA